MYFFSLAGYPTQVASSKSSVQEQQVSFKFLPSLCPESFQQSKQVIWLGPESLWKETTVRFWIQGGLYELVLSPSVMSDFLRSHGLQPTSPWDFPGKNTGMGSHFLFLTLGSNQNLLHFLHWQADSLPPCHLGSPLWFGTAQFKLMFAEINFSMVSCALAYLLTILVCSVCIEMGRNHQDTLQLQDAVIKVIRQSTRLRGNLKLLIRFSESTDTFSTSLLRCSTFFFLHLGYFTLQFISKVFSHQHILNYALQSALL